MDKIWSAEGILQKHKPHIVSKIKQIYLIYINLGKSANRPANNPRETFVTESNDDFDISHQDAKSHIDNDNDMDFSPDEAD